MIQHRTIWLIGSLWIDTKPCQSLVATAGDVLLSDLQADLCRPGTSIAEAGAHQLRGGRAAGAFVPIRIQVEKREPYEALAHECPQCHGILVETYSDIASLDHAGEDVIGRRSVNGGEYVDRLSLLNQWAQQDIPLLFPSAGRRMVDVSASIASFNQSSVDRRGMISRQAVSGKRIMNTSRWKVP